jgi:sulfide dehydrogenase cytochrome subunit
MFKVIKNVFTVTVSVTLLLPGNAIAQGVDRGHFLASMCFICHGYRGQGSKRVPSLDDHTAKELIEYMQGFKTGEESSTIMGRHAAGYTDEEIRLIAEFYARQE